MPRGSPQPLPPVSESQLRARLSGVTTTSSSNPSSELATRLMAGKNFESSYQGAQGQPRIVGTPNSAPGMHESSPESLFNEINNSQFLQNTATNNYAEKFEEFASEKAVGSWKESQNTNDLRSSWLSRLSKALETSANINSAEAASRMAGDIEEKAFQSADTEHLAPGRADYEQAFSGLNLITEKISGTLFEISRALAKAPATP